MSELRKRASAVIVENGKVLLIKRVKPDAEYYIFPGGGVDENESIEEALKREVKEELNLKVEKFKPLFSIENLSVPSLITIHKDNRNEFYLLVEKFSGVPEISGPERERMNEQNQYHLEWVDLSKLEEMKNVYPREGVAKLMRIYANLTYG